ncbi:MAG TPA: winged helix-turn-helix transcriptional regulator [Nitrososphaera sp.]|nr:winged helix-turn-helix transcriptional regulator [Nitrososphaera sp.]
MKSLSKLDKDILRILLSPDGRMTSKAIAKALDIPATTVQRRRRKLEDSLLTITYSLDLKRFGWHKIDFLIATEKGRTMTIAKQLLKLDEVVYVGRAIGQQTIDLHVQAILEGNADILRVMEMLKAMPGIKDVVWSEIVQVVGRKTSVPTHIIEKL